jgi:hypothetical protein
MCRTLLSPVTESEVRERQRSGKTTWVEEFFSADGACGPRSAPLRAYASVLFGLGGLDRQPRDGNSVPGIVDNESVADAVRIWRGLTLGGRKRR